MKNEIDFNWKLIGAKLANLSEKEQSEFFEGFCQEVDHWGSHFQKETQMLYINEKLKEETKGFMGDYFPCLWFKEATQ